MTASDAPSQVFYIDGLSCNPALTLPGSVSHFYEGLHGPLGARAQTHRSPRNADATAEIATMVALAKALAESPHSVFQLLADSVLALLKGESAGVSVLDPHSDGSTRIRWPAIAGRWHAHSGSSRTLIASGETTDTADTADTISAHALVVPFTLAGQNAGTVWVVTDESAPGFHTNDLQQLQNLSPFAALALKATSTSASASTSKTAASASTLQAPPQPSGLSAALDSLIENAPIGVYVIDAQFRLCQASAMARQAFASIQPLIGRAFGDIVHAVWPEPFASSVLANFRRTLESGEPYAEPSLNERRSDKTDIESYDWKIERIVFPDGSFGVVCYYYDLTERQRATEALRLHMARFEALVNDAPMGIFLVDAELCVLQVNALAVKELGYFEGLIGYPVQGAIQTLCGSERAVELVQRFRETLVTGIPFEVTELTSTRAGCGSIACHDWHVGRIPLPDGSHGAVCYMRDVSARVTAQAQIRESEMRLRAFVTSSTDVVYRMSADWREMHYPFGRSVVAGTAEPRMNWLQDYIPPQDRAHLLAAINAAISAKGNFVLEHRVRQVNGELGWIQSRAVPLLNADGEIVEWFGTATDITSRKRVEATLLEALAIAENANKAKSEFLSHMSHELRSPMHAVLGFAQLLQSGVPPPTTDQEECVVEILKAGWYLLGLIDEILDLSLIESGHLSCVLEPVPLAAVLHECLALVEGQAADRGILLSIPPPDDSCVVVADRGRLKQVLINILSNAIKYNHEGGSVQVGWATPWPGCIRIRVEDTGNGLSSEQLQQVFQPFERLGQEKGVIEGTGIGLALSKRLVELMGGRIGADSVVGKGSVFWIELDAPGAETLTPAPAQPSRPEPHSFWPADVEPAGHAAPSSASDRTFTVLCVEDNRANQLLVERLLARRSDVHLLLASDGPQGVQLAHDLRPDVVLMDINLPSMSGLEAMKRLAADPATASIPVIAVSAMAMPHDIDNALLAGFFRYLSKPIRIDDLTDALDAALAWADLRTAPVGANSSPPVAAKKPAISSSFANAAKKEIAP